MSVHQFVNFKPVSKSKIRSIPLSKFTSADGCTIHRRKPDGKTRTVTWVVMTGLLYLAKRLLN